MEVVARFGLVTNFAHDDLTRPRGKRPLDLLIHAQPEQRGTDAGGIRGEQSTLSSEGVSEGWLRNPRCQATPRARRPAVGFATVAMLLFKKAFFEGLQSGAITLTFRRWAKPHVKPGGRYRCHPIGVLEVDAIVKIAAGRITDADATRAGFASRELLRADLAQLGPLDDDTELWRVELHHGGDGDRVSLALEDALTPDEVAEIRARLARMDAKKPWTNKTFALIAANPRIAASKLALAVKRPTLEFKTDVRKLKKLGLTQSFEVGYEISPRGRAYLAAATKPARARTR